jgi:hypothetical protein
MGDFQGYYIFDAEDFIGDFEEYSGLDFHGSDSGGSTYLHGAHGSEISQFPGNCSTLVLTGIQDLGTIQFLAAINYAEKFCAHSGHAQLMFSLANVPEDREEMIAQLGYHMFSSVINYHGGNMNKFFVKTIQYYEEESNNR